MIIGGFDQPLAARFSNLFEQVIAVDWDNPRLTATMQSLSEHSFTAHEINIGTPQFPEDKFELIMVFWSSSYLGNPTIWIKELAERLHPRGRMVVIDRAERSTTPEQDLTNQITDMLAKSEALAGVNLHPCCAMDGLTEIIQSCSFHRINRKFFTDPDLLTSSEYRREDAFRALTRVEKLVEMFLKTQKSDKNVLDSIKELQTRSEELRKTLQDKTPGTPPFYMIKAIRQSTFIEPIVGSRSSTIELESSLETSGKLAVLSDLPQDQQENEVDETFTEEAATATYMGKFDDSTTNPFDRLLLYGPDNLKNHELMTLIIRGLPDAVLKGLDPERLTQRLIREYGTKAISEERNPGRLAEMLGISQSIACMIVAVFELGRRFYAEPHNREPVIRGPEDCYHYLRDMGSLKKEHLRGLYLNVQSRLIHDEVISIGTLSRSVVHPREVFSPALDHSAHSVILAHNHPSGDLTPSEADVVITKQLAQAGRIMGIELLDHLIIGADGFVSLKKKRII